MQRIKDKMGSSTVWHLFNFWKRDKKEVEVKKSHQEEDTSKKEEIEVKKSGVRQGKQRQW